MASARFGWTRGGGTVSHGGVDLHALVGTPVLAIADGVIEAVNPSHGNYGVSVLLKFRLHAGYRTRLQGEPRLDKSGVFYALYAHLLPGSVHVQRGLRVVRGVTQLGQTGVSGNGDQKYPHLHFEIRKRLNADSTRTEEGIQNRLDPERLFRVDYIEPFEAIDRLNRTA